MPIYVYGCDACDHRFEQFQKFSDDPIRQCPKCHSKVRRIFQPAGIVFKGSGWHITDYKRSSNGGEASGNGETKTDAAKPAAASESKSAPKNGAETAA